MEFTEEDKPLVRQTSMSGGQKDAKLARFSLLPQAALHEVAEVYGYGAKKYEANNWRKGYPYSWSLDALGRHLNAFSRGEELDPESGSHHLAHAAFHILTLLEWRLNADQDYFDDRVN